MDKPRKAAILNVGMLGRWASIFVASGSCTSRFGLS